MGHRPVWCFLAGSLLLGCAQPAAPARAFEEYDSGGVMVRVDSSEAAGHYANMAVLNHTEQEFTLDFIQLDPTDPKKAQVRSRVITSPEHAKRLLAALQDNVNKYEQKFHPIRAE